MSIRRYAVKRVYDPLAPCQKPPRWTYTFMT